MSQDVAVVGDEEDVTVSAELPRRKQQRMTRGFYSEKSLVTKPKNPNRTMYLGASFITSISGMSEPTTPSRIPWDSWGDGHQGHNWKLTRANSGSTCWLLLRTRLVTDNYYDYLLTQPVTDTAAPPPLPPVPSLSSC